MHDAAFDDFYRRTRAQLLHLAFLTTGDLTAATRGTERAYVIAWHHWKKVGSLPDPLTWVRPLALRLAQRRHTGRLWHRSAPMSDAQRAVLDALSGLGGTDRRLLVLVHAGGLPLAEVGPELALTQEAAARRLAKAEAALAFRLATTTDTIPRRLTELGPLTAAVVLPRTPLVLRSGRRRRHLQTAAIATGVLAVTVVAGVVAELPTPEEVPAGATPEEEPESTLSDTLLTADDLSVMAKGLRWRVEGTSDNTKGDGIHTICQRERFADPDGLGALVRTFSTLGRPAGAVQTTEVSRSVRDAKAALDTMVRWVGGCQEERVQLVATYRVSGVGDQARLMVLRAAGTPTPVHTVAMARTGTMVTSVTTRAGSPQTLRPGQVVRALDRAVTTICRLDEEATCGPGRPRLQPARPPAAETDRGMLAVVDLPAIPGLDFAWIGVDTEPAKRRNPASTLCDTTRFGSAVKARTRTFLVPEADVPLRFGLDETVGVFKSAAAARGFVSTVAQRMATCEDREVTAEVTTVASTRRTDSDLVLWDLAAEVDENTTVRYRMGVVRAGKRVAQLRFVPTEGDDLTTAQMLALLRRAGERMREIG